MEKGFVQRTACSEDNRLVVSTSLTLPRLPLGPPPRPILRVPSSPSHPYHPILPIPPVITLALHPFQGFDEHDIAIKCIGIGSDDDENDDDESDDDEVAGVEVKQEDGEAGGGGGGGGSAVKDLPMPTVDPEAQRNPEKASQKKNHDYPACI